MFKRTRILVCAVIVLAPASFSVAAYAQTPTTMDHSQMNMAPTTAATTAAPGGSGGGAATTGGGGGGAATTGGGATGSSQATGGGATRIARTGTESQALTTFAGTMVLLGALLLLAASNRFASGGRVNA